MNSSQPYTQPSTAVDDTGSGLTMFLIFTAAVLIVRVAPSSARYPTLSVCRHGESPTGPAQGPICRHPGGFRGD